MKKLKAILKWFGIVLLIFVLLLIIYLRVNYGGGKEYPDISTAPIYNKGQLEEVLSYPEPIGNVAATNDSILPTRVFFTVHPESRPSHFKLLEYSNGAIKPYPNEAAQDELFNTVLGLFCDQHNRLWTIDHGNHGFEEVTLLAFDLATSKVVHQFQFPRSVAERLSFFNDLSVTPDGRYVFVADVSFFGRTPSLVIYDTVTRQSRSLLDGHSSVSHEGYVPVTTSKKMRFFGGIVDLLTGIDGIDISLDGQYVYYAPMGHSQLFRIPVEACTDHSRSTESLVSAVETVSQKPLSDGIRCDHNGLIYITDVENQGIYIINPETKKKATLIKDERIKWADGLSLAGDGYLYLADSDIPNQMLKSKKHIAAHSPYSIYRFKTYSGDF